ncbi:helix-turn-helix domain-containing protein [Enterococcus asini]|uniref:helix-turn-helix domain-containing protein n=1 Tax=Enterococcus asini TaxID=57732 RepID=UPI00288CC60F|nr:helix-turn-helix domain-containing protein [Enterococcus asini]MDT2757147.1 helix-turn-helix domain-containing protein [Enterococcus asini]
MESEEGEIMYSLAKQMISEKEVRRKITILEQLLSTAQMTTKDLAQQLGVSQRTVFHDLQTLRYELPEDWQLEAQGNQGVSLTASRPVALYEVWEFYMEQSLAMVVLKGLLFKRELSVVSFLMDNGVSYETLKRQVQKMNQELTDFQLTIRLTRSQLSWVGEESSLRVFYHRLLTPFTHQHFFFEDYQVHESNYRDFLASLKRQNKQAKTEEIFGICWFFINTIRIKAGCSIENLHYEEDDLAFSYQESIQTLYQKEGVLLKGDEAFFAYFCFLESWSYLLSPDVSQLLQKNYGHLFQRGKAYLNTLVEGVLLADDQELLEDLVLFQVKYYESKSLTDKFLGEYAEVLHVCQEKFPSLYQDVARSLATGELEGITEVSNHAVSNLVLLIQTAKARLNLQPLRVFLIFQGEPAWKQFLIQELQDLAGKRVKLIEINATEVPTDVKKTDIILSNLPLEKTLASVVSLSMVPTDRELWEFRKLIQKRYL